MYIADDIIVEATNIST